MNYSTKIKELKDELLRVQNEFRESSPFKIGDRVYYCGRELLGAQSPQVYLVYSFGISSKHQLSYNLTLPKKDGGMPEKMIKGRSFISVNELKAAV